MKHQQNVIQNKAISFQTISYMILQCLTYHPLAYSNTGQKF